MNAPDPNAGVYVSLDHLVRLRYEARGFSLLPRQPVTSLLAGGHASKLRGRGLDFDEIRKYLPGDDPRTIDWKVTARTRTPHSRVYTEERERPVLLLIDQRIGMFFGSVKQMKSVVAAEAAALATWRTIAVKDRIGAIVFNDAEMVEIRPKRARSHAMHLMSTVVDFNRKLRAVADAPPNPGMLNAVLQRAARVATHDFLVVLISDAAGADSISKQHVTNLARHNDFLVAFVFDPLEKDLPAAGTLVVSDGAKQLAIDSRSSSVRTAFRREFDERSATVRSFLQSREVPVLPLSTERDASEQILSALGARPGGRRA